MSTLIASTHSSRVTKASKHTAVAALGLAALSLLAVNANAAKAAESKSSEPQTTVDFKDLDLSKQSDTKRLYQRLRLAASEVCVGYAQSTSVLRKNTPRARCEDAAVANAVETIGNPNLTSLHESQPDARLAQSKRKSDANI